MILYSYSISFHAFLFIYFLVLHDRISSEKSQQIILYFLCVIFLEICLYYLSPYFLALRGNNFLAFIVPPPIEHVYVHEPNKIYTYSNPGEFSFDRKSNSLGFADKDWEIEKSENLIRILTLGDSFT